MSSITVTPLNHIHYFSQVWGKSVTIIVGCFTRVHREFLACATGPITAQASEQAVLPCLRSELLKSCGSAGGTKLCVFNACIRTVRLFLVGLGWGGGERGCNRLYKWCCFPLLIVRIHSMMYLSIALIKKKKILSTFVRILSPYFYIVQRRELIYRSIALYKSY